MTITCLSAEELAPILDRRRNRQTARYIPKIPLKSLLITILEKANDFVPSESGSILLDDPSQKIENAARRELTFVCCFGPAADSLVGDRIAVDNGIAGQVYKTGVSIVTNNTYQMPQFSDRYDRKLGYRTESVLCVAIRIGSSICGVIELLNKNDPRGYQESEKGLLEIFAQYISSTIQNAIDAKKIEKMVRMDDLTGLANDRYLHEKLPVEVEAHVISEQPLSVIFLDLDRFKSINDTHGHMAGSNTLAEFGHLLAATINRDDATMARYGGDEFVILLPSTTRQAAIAAAEEVRKATETHVFLERTWGNDEKPLHLKNIITASIGTSTFQVSDGTGGLDTTSIAIKLLQTADQAMYDSKEKGKNRVTEKPFTF